MRAWHLAAAVGVALGAMSSQALADDTIKRPGDHPHYKFEIEPHGVIGSDFSGWGWGFGAGVRASIPIMDNGFVPKINNVPAITFGADWLHYSTGCYYAHAGACAASNSDTFYFPVGLQWNFFVAKRWSVFAEAGIAPYYRAFGNYCAAFYPPGSRDYAICDSSAPNHVYVTPWGDVGARFHFNDHVALTMRIGFPTFTIGVSFM